MWDNKVRESKPPSSGSPSHCRDESPSLRANKWSHGPGGSTQILQEAILSQCALLLQALYAASIPSLQVLLFLHPWQCLLSTGGSCAPTHQQSLLSIALSFSNSYLYNLLCLKSSLTGTIIRYCLLHTGWKRGRNLTRKIFSLPLSKSSLDFIILLIVCDRHLQSLHV